ncbi:MAG: extracellular solute-binding protein [Clostridia bacterium]|nr:extracellular solute-binding protein [Clostridia bacterium]MBN2882596.1 extracellular solute-binding protein [Clostridia bacterium]
MKKVIPVSILILICFLLALTGSMHISDFSITTPELELSPLPVPPSMYFNDPDAINLVECQFYGDYQDNPDWKEIWPRVIEEHYGININIVYPPISKYMDTIAAAASSGELTGIVEIFGGPYVEEWKEKELIYPLKEYLAGNEIWNTLIPEYWKDLYTIEDDIWAIPSGDDGMIIWKARFMRGDWLDKFGIGKPYTIDEFYQASYNFTYGDPEGNGRDDTVGFTSAGLSNLHDIFQAYDARLSTNAGSTLTWNPNTDIWEDSMIKPEMVECLEFLRECYSERILDQECFTGMTDTEMIEKVSSGFYGGTFIASTFALNSESKIRGLFPDAYMLCIGGLSHNIDRNLNPYGPGPAGSPRVLMKNTPQPEETINWFVNTFFGDEWGFWTGRLGPVGDYPGQDERACTVEGKTIVRNTYVDQTGSIKTYPGPGYIGGLPSRALYSIYEVVFYVPSPPQGFETWAEDTALRANDNTKRINSWIAEYIENGMAYILPERLTKPTSDLYIELFKDINDATRDAIQKAISGEISIDDAIEQYRMIAKALGFKEILDFENKKLEKATVQDY